MSGYETDSLIPFVAYLGIGLAAALAYAMTRAHRRQHRGLTLTSMAVGIAATLLALSYLVDAPGISEGGRDLSPEIGVWLALRRAAVGRRVRLVRQGDRGRRPPRRPRRVRARPRGSTPSPVSPMHLLYREGRIRHRIRPSRCGAPNGAITTADAGVVDRPPAAAGPTPFG